MAAKVTLDLKGLKCPLPGLKLSQEATKHGKGDVIEAIADCPTFESDVRGWATRTKHTLLWVRPESGAKHVAVSLAYGQDAELPAQPVCAVVGATVGLLSSGMLAGLSVVQSVQMHHGDPLTWALTAVAVIVTTGTGLLAGRQATTRKFLSAGVLTVEIGTAIGLLLWLLMAVRTIPLAWMPVATAMPTLPAALLAVRPDLIVDDPTSNETED